MNFPVHQTKTATQTMALGKALGKTLLPGDAVFCFGDLGAGKTHFIKGVAEGLGIKETIKSPTFTFLRSYDCHSCESRSPEKNKKVLDNVFHHYDLYRLNGPAAIESTGYFETIEDKNAVHAVEWADRLEKKLPAKRIEVDLNTGDRCHTIKIQWISKTYCPLNEVKRLYNEFQTPVHVQNHCAAVARVALVVGSAMIKKTRLLNLEGVYVAALLHDLLRIVDMQGFSRNHGFNEKISDKKWQRWQRQRQKYQGQNHAQVAAAVLQQKGYTQTAELIRHHMNASIIETPEKLDTLEKRLVFYADKRAAGDRIVTLKERFEDFQRRTGLSPKKFTPVYRAVQKLEKELFRGLSMVPDAIL